MKTNYHTQRINWYVSSYIYYTYYTHPFNHMSISGVHTHTFGYMHSVNMHHTIVNGFDSMCDTLSHYRRYSFVTNMMRNEVSLHGVEKWIPRFRGAYPFHRQILLYTIACKCYIHTFREYGTNQNLLLLFSYDCNMQWMLSGLVIV